jgi:transposase
LDGLCGRNPKITRAWALNESFQEFRNARNEGFAEGIFPDWYRWALRSQLAPMVKVAKILKRHLDVLMNYFKHRITNAVSEGNNRELQSIKASA